MSEYESLREDIASCAKAIDRYGDTAVRHLLEQSTQIDKLWDDNAELRDELHALANRVEALTRAHLTEPAEVAEAIQRGNVEPEVARVLPYPICKCGHRFDHHRHHGELGCYERGCTCRGYGIGKISA